MSIKLLISKATFLAVIGPCISTQATDQWSVVRLHPAGAWESNAWGTSGTHQVGAAWFGNDSVASLWSGTAESQVDLNPAAASSSRATGASGTQQVGWATVNGNDHASLWSGTAASWVDLHPAGATGSQAQGTSGTHQVGWVKFSLVGGERASLWSGTANSWVDLHPAGASWSIAYGTSGTQQVGVTWVGANSYASLWSGTAASWVNLQPAGAAGSWATGTSGLQQVGTAIFGFGYRASLWSGTAASWVNLHPVGASASHALGTFGVQQVGTAEFGGVWHAGLWSNTAESWVDLSVYLTGSWGNTWAESIWHDGTRTYIAGRGHNNVTNRGEALLWVASDPAPSAEIDNAFVYHPNWSGEGSGMDSQKQMHREGSGLTMLSYANLLNSSHGINGIGFDLRYLPNDAALTLHDFEFQWSPQNSFSEVLNPPQSWLLAPSPVSFVVTALSEEDSLVRVWIEWQNNHLENRWLRVTVKSNQNTGLLQPHVYYIGHLRGETTGADGASYTVSFADISVIRQTVGTQVDASSVVDIDKNGVVSFADIGAMRSTVGTILPNITVP